MNSNNRNIETEITKQNQESVDARWGKLKSVLINSYGSVKFKFNFKVLDLSLI